LQNISHFKNLATVKSCVNGCYRLHQSHLSYSTNVILQYYDEPMIATL